ncbi:MAG TPA: M14 family zinc carboxypeptidase [Syntrophomonadaceae bacterium]|nr:M14 family zinc carboxypeptidase [Syntrophomonadaceae bacterium]
MGLTEDNIPSSGKSTIEYNIIGHSSRDAIIYDVVITPPEYNKTLLLTFAMHGFEGSWNNDGGTLVQIANDLIREFSSRPEELQNTRLIIVPCVNPDGVWFGKTDKGFGRCNSQGIDINRDFDYHWEFISESKYRTGRAPFTTPEARILRDLVLNEKPDAIIDFHGWLNCTYGDAELGSYFYKAFGIKHHSSVSKDKIYMQQYFTGWASQFARTVMVEYPNPVNPGNINNLGYSYKTINAVKELCSKLQHVPSSK